MNFYSVKALLSVLLLLGCASSDDTESDTDRDAVNGTSGFTDTDSNGAHDDSSSGQEGDTVAPQIVSKVYAHSATILYQVDPDDLTLTEVGPFVWPEGLTGEQMTDIAVDAAQNMIGVSFGRVYSVDKETAECTYLADLSDGFNGLSFVDGDGTSDETTLVGATTSGEWYTLDMETGASSLIGTYGEEMSSSGDIVFIRDAGAYATVNHPDYTTDVLVTVDPSSGSATVIGETGFDDIWGIGYWGGQIFGFTERGEFILIDATTGLGTLVETLDASFWGAGVTTLAPVVV